MLIIARVQIPRMEIQDLDIPEAAEGATKRNSTHPQELGPHSTHTIYANKSEYSISSNMSKRAGMCYALLVNLTLDI